MSQPRIISSKTGRFPEDLEGMWQTPQDHHTGGDGDFEIGGDANYETRVRETLKLG